MIHRLIFILIIILYISFDNAPPTFFRRLLSLILKVFLILCLVLVLCLRFFFREFVTHHNKIGKVLEVRHTPEVHHECHISCAEYQGEKDQSDHGANTRHNINLTIVEGVTEVVSYRGGTTC